MNQFYKAQGTKTGYRYDCKECYAAVGKSKYDSLTPEAKAAKLRRQKHNVAWKKYRLEADEVEALLSGGCMVCGSYNRLAIDHDHACCESDYTCGECLRGVLCYECNVSEGLLGSDPNRMMALANYIMKMKEVSHGDQRV